MTDPKPTCYVVDSLSYGKWCMHIEPVGQYQFDGVDLLIEHDGRAIRLRIDRGEVNRITTALSTAAVQASAIRHEMMSS